ncbi:hypothetical protein SBA1_230008 [Candidatus Sulfotelmatobacter kueseliae]|uniref:Uncharacterized protein n=1 Tax=Candidatus Sulfotelmatobacter kueseliae TaxID=2042962 RepID=A0A2U3KGZ3_9BACT|nr:hypothetical protein SBA1_230008 [Candidatus Sulfotelmatobacter kueseliae]
MEERSFEGRVTKRKKENNSTLPKAVAGERSSQATRATDELRYEKLSDQQEDQVLSQIKIMQDAGEKQPASQDDLRVFRAFAKAGQRLAEIHVHYEQQPEYPLTKGRKGRRKNRLPRHENEAEQGQDLAHLQPVPYPLRHPARDLRIPPRQPLSSGMGH